RRTRRCDRERGAFPVTSPDRRVSENPFEKGTRTTTPLSPPTSHRTPTRPPPPCRPGAGPVWGAVSLAQAATREGFDLTRHPLSALANGSLGWLQIANFLVAGVLTIAGATGLRRALHGGRGGTWVPRLVRL